MTNEKHTPTPWALGIQSGITGPTTPSCDGPTVAGRRWRHEIVTAGMETIAICPNQGSSADQQDGSGFVNAAFIVKAVNAYEPMLDALKKLTAEMVGIGGFGPEIRELVGNTNWAVLTQRVQEAHAAIAKAETQS